jgi:hypothetical protein
MPTHVIFIEQSWDMDFEGQPNAVRTDTDDIEETLRQYEFDNGCRIIGVTRVEPEDFVFVQSDQINPEALANRLKPIKVADLPRLEDAYRPITGANLQR